MFWGFFRSNLKDCGSAMGSAVVMIVAAPVIFFVAPALFILKTIDLWRACSWRRHD